MIHHRAQAFLDAFDIDTTIVDVGDGSAGAHRLVVINFAGKSWVIDFAHHDDHDFADVRLFDDCDDVAFWHKGTAAMEHPDALSTPIGVFGMIQGMRRKFAESSTDDARNHGWPAAATITLLADN